MSKDKSLFAATFKSIVGETNLKAIKDAFTKFNAAPVIQAPAPAPVALDSVTTTQDGKTLSIAGQAPAVGVAVMDTTSGTPTPLADGDYVLADGSTITVVAGMITVYTPDEAEPAMPPMDMTAATTALKAEFAAQKVAFEKSFTTKFAAQEKEITELKATVTDLVKMNGMVVDAFTKLSEEPAQEPSKKNEPVDTSNMTPLQAYKYQKYGKID